MTASEILRRLDKETTAGPWRHVEKGRVFNAHHLVTEGYVAYPGGDDPEDETPETLAAEALTERTGKMIATLRNALPALADLVAAVESIKDFACHWQPTHPKATDPTCPPCIASRALAALRERLVKP
jgi:hypothetical protein